PAGWLPPPSPRAGPVTVIGYVPASGRFITATRPRRSFRDPRGATAGGALARYSDKSPDTLALAYGYALVDTLPQRDPRSLRPGVPESSTPQRALIRDGRPIHALRIRVTGDARRQAFVAARGRLPK